MRNLFLAQSLVVIAAIFPGYASEGQNAASGVLLGVFGDVSVAGLPALQGATLLQGDVINTGQNSSAWLQFGPHSLATLRSDTQLSITSDRAGRVVLRHGTILVQQKSGEDMRVGVRGAWVAIHGSGASQSLCEIASLTNSSEVRLQQGWAEIRSPYQAPVVLHPGQWARLTGGDFPDAGQTGGSAAPAGTVTREMPRGTVDRQGQQNLPLNLNDPVQWNDLIHTVGAGRLQVTLSDGSVLNIGSRSELRLTQYDPNAQQTDLELTAGRIRADVQKITKTGGKFQVHTRTAVIGVVGTSFVVDAQPNQTSICDVTGQVQVSTSDPNNPQTVTLNPGECVVVLPSGPPSAPVTGGNELATLISQTTVGGGGAAGGAAGAGGAVLGGGHLTLILLGTGLALGGVFGGLAAAGQFSSGTQTVSP